MDATTQIIISIIGTSIAVSTFLYTIIRNFKADLYTKFAELDIEIRDMRSDIKDIRNDLKETRTSLNRMEGAFYSKECCILKDDKQNRKAE